MQKKLKPIKSGYHTINETLFYNHSCFINLFYSLQNGCTITIAMNQNESNHDLITIKNSDDLQNYLNTYGDYIILDQLKVLINKDGNITLNFTCDNNIKRR